MTHPAMLNVNDLCHRIGVPNPEQFPHLPQKYTANPLTHCFPASASNLVEYHKRAAQQLQDVPQRMIEARLADYFQTDRHGVGTSMPHFLNGLTTFLKEQHLDYERIRYEGPLGGTDRFKLTAHDHQPTLAHIEQSLVKGEPLIGSLGWYYFNKASQSYVRDGSHAVTLIGLERPLWRPGQVTLLVRDPHVRPDNPWKEPTLSRLPLQAIRATAARLTSEEALSDDVQHFPVPAKGFFQVNKVFPYKPQKTLAILESVVSIEGLKARDWAA